MAKVFVINDSGQDFKKAKRFGELVVVTSGRVPIFNGLTTCEEISKGLKDFDISEDYLLIVGPPMLTAFSVLEVAHKGPFIKVLMFDAKQQNYTVRHLSTRKGDM